MTTETIERVSPGVLEALTIGSLPDVEWKQGDDLCDCVYQRIGSWTNPYLAETLEVRMCCIWAELYKQFPAFVRSVPAYWNANVQAWQTKAAAWDGESEMPKAMWHRQLAREQDRPLDEIRAEYAEKDHLRPKGRGESIPFTVKIAGAWRTLNLASRRSR